MWQSHYHKMKLKTLKDLDRTCTCGHENTCKGDDYCNAIEIADLKQEAIDELKMINDLSFKTPELRTETENILMNAESYIKWKFNITDEDLRKK